MDRFRQAPLAEKGVRKDPPPDKSLEPSAERVAEAWYSVRAKRLGIQRPAPQKSLKRDRRWKDYMRIAGLCLDSGWDPDDFVRAGVDYLGANGAFMVPSDLLSDGVRKRYAKEVASLSSEAAKPAEEWEYACQLLDSMAHGDPDAESRALMSPFSPFPAWFRVVRGRLPASPWDSLARDELRDAPSLCDWLHSRFPNEVEGLFSSEGGRNG